MLPKKYYQSMQFPEVLAMIVENPYLIQYENVAYLDISSYLLCFINLFRMHDVTFESHNVLADEDIRQGIKEYSNWPTIPQVKQQTKENHNKNNNFIPFQVYFDGEFIGGCDILLQMHQSGELVEELQKVGIKSALLSAEEPEKK